MTERMTPEQVPDDLVTRALQVRDQAANVVYGDAHQMRHVLAAVLSEVRAAERVEYGCQFTGWTFDVGIEKWDVKLESTGTGEPGLREARRVVESTREWQPRQELPVDAVVVFRPVSEWAVLAEASAPWEVNPPTNRRAPAFNAAVRLSTLAGRENFTAVVLGCGGDPIYIREVGAVEGKELPVIVWDGARVSSSVTRRFAADTPVEVRDGQVVRG